MRFILIPGLWLAADSWGGVPDLLRKAGHEAHALTLPGLESRDAGRAGLGLDDHLGAVLAAVEEDPEPAVVVGHSAAATLAHLAADAWPDSVARTVMIGGMPAAEGSPFLEGFAADGDDVPFPGWPAFEPEDVRDLDDEARARLEAIMRPSPAGVLETPVTYRDARRHQVRVTLVCPEFTVEDARQWMAAGFMPELAAGDDVELVDIDSGHWPQVTRPAELSAILAAAGSR
ncbi:MULTISPECIES: alpha/beta hydrolase [Actinomycetes]|uniref:Alpha/beta hydrolase n=2 Tax=Actinomycetes TaxID=1760 RepID=A0ABP6LWZ4_9MICC